MMFLVVFTISILIVCLEYGCKENNAGYSLYEVTAFNKDERAALYSLHMQNENFIFMNGVTNEASIPMNVLVGLCCTNEFEAKLLENNIEYTLVKNVSLVNKVRSFDKGAGRGSILYSQNVDVSHVFNSWQRIERWIIRTVKKYSIVKRIIAGHTHENRELIILKVSTGKKDSAVFILGGEMGRDWMSPAIILNFIEDLLENKHKKNMTDYYDFYFLPIMNPDGYEFSMNKDMLWSKNRKLFFPKVQCPLWQGNDSSEKVAVGVNIDRNWHLTQPSYYSGTCVQKELCLLYKKLLPIVQPKGEECDSVYIGYQELSEEEPQALSKFLNSTAIDLMAFVNVRGFERIISVPYGYSHEYSNNHDILMETLANICDNLQRRYNTSYYYGNTANLMYNFSGNSADWVKMMMNVPVVFTIYMKYQDYLLPDAKHILPLTKQFTSIMQESLLLAHSIYGPLFSNQIMCTARFVTIFLPLSVTLFNFTMQ